MALRLAGGLVLARVVDAGLDLLQERPELASTRAVRAERVQTTIQRSLVPTSLAEFEDDTGFERYVLDRITPLVPGSETSSVIELSVGGSASNSVAVQPATIRVGISDSMGTASGAVRIDDIRPLLFGAAWKVIDQLIELGLEQAGAAHDRKADYTVKFKVQQATNGAVPAVPPFHARPHLWSRVLKIYAATEVLRNSLTHRRLFMDPTTGDITGVARHGKAPPPTLAASEQSAFCQLAVGLAEAAIEGALPKRRVDQLRWVLDLLSVLHGQSSFGVSPANGLVPVVIVRPLVDQSGNLTLDFADIARRARAAVGGVSHYDLRIHLPEDRVLAGLLEDAPEGPASVSLYSPPDWLRWV